jgi:uncharacterized membrane protein SpoIIM required for sporulation
MKVADLLEARRQNWRELELLCARMEALQRKVTSEELVRFAAMYRAACADLALADSYQLPQQTVSYLHHLVGRAHNQLYRSRPFHYDAWTKLLFQEVPQRLLADRCLWLASALFWGFFLLCMALAYIDRDFAGSVVPESALTQMDEMYAEPIGARKRGMDADNLMAGFYIQHNTTIGLRCFVMGTVLGVGGLYETLQNACVLGTIFGYMARGDNWQNFFHFVTAHGPFELTAIVLAAAAGMRLGFSLIDTRGWSRGASMVQAAREAVPAIFSSIVLFALAAFIEGFISPSAPPSFWPATGPGAETSWYWAFKFPVAIFCTLALLFYFFALGLPRRAARATG